MEVKSFLTFNPDLRSLADLLALPELNDKPSEVVDLPLNRVWTVWEQIERKDQKDYSSSTKDVAVFSTVSEFWKIWSVLPQPSQLMLNKKMVRVTPDKKTEIVDAIMIFRDNVRPMWEDPLNSIGGHFEIRYPYSNNAEEQAQLDEHWNNLVLGIIGATIDPEAMITGVRLVDKLHQSGKAGGFIRLEIWFTEIAACGELKQILRNNIMKSITTKLDGSKSTTKLPIITRSHNKGK